jgi:uncharacterized lipoprotein YajG
MPGRVLLAAAVFVLAACADPPRRLAQPTGPTFRLNPDRWIESVAAGERALP